MAIKAVESALKSASVVIVGQPILGQDKAAQVLSEFLSSIRSEMPVHTILAPSREPRGESSQRRLPVGAFGDPVQQLPTWSTESEIGELMGWAAACRNLKMVSPELFPPSVTDEATARKVMANPVVLGSLGSPEIQLALRQAAGYARVPFLTWDASGEFIEEQLPPVRLSTALEAFRVACVCDAGTGRQRAKEICGTTLLVEREGELYPTQLLTSILMDGQSNIFARPDYHSACADLLDRRGWLEEAAALRRLTEYWVAQGLWSSNLVPEMVSHGAAHSQSVDRIIASLCEPLLEAERLVESDVVILACAAWLHDWGCNASCHYGTRLPTDPRDVRRFHGYFSADRLRTGKRTHLLDEKQGFAECEHYGEIIKFGSVSDQTALLSAHHMGWTSCGQTEPTTQPVRRPAQFTVEYREANGRPHRKGPVVRSFDNEYRSIADIANLGQSDRDAGLVRARHLLALIRVADAMDVGWHRVPNVLTQKVARRDSAHAFFAESQRVEGAICSAAESVQFGDAIRYIKEAFDGALKSESLPVKGAKQELIDCFSTESADSPDWLIDEDDLEAKIAKFREGYGKTSRAATEFAENAVDAYCYAEHVLAQEVYYGEQQLVRSVVPVLDKTAEGRLQLNFHIVAGQSGEQLMDRRSAEQAKSLIQAFLYRELGRAVQRPGHPWEESNQNKLPIEGYLRELTIDIPAGLDDLVNDPFGYGVLPGARRKSFDGVPVPPLAPTAMLDGYGEWRVLERVEDGTGVKECTEHVPDEHGQRLLTCANKSLPLGTIIAGKLLRDARATRLSNLPRDTRSVHGLALRSDQKQVIVRKGVQLYVGDLDENDRYKCTAFPIHFQNVDIPSIVAVHYLKVEDQWGLIGLAEDGTVFSQGGHDTSQYGRASGLDVAEIADDTWIAWASGGTVHIKNVAGTRQASDSRDSHGSVPLRGVWISGGEAPLVVVEKLSQNDGIVERSFRTWRPEV